MKNFGHHLQHYFPLLGILCLGIIGFWLFSYDRNFQKAIILSTAAGYIAWGLVHHHIHGNLHWQVVAEYFAIAVLGIVVVSSILY